MTPNTQQIAHRKAIIDMVNQITSANSPDSRRTGPSHAGSVVSTGLSVEGARRGYNPHRRKVPFWRWLDLRECVVIYRKLVFHNTVKNYQLDLFDPDTGTFAYSAIGTNPQTLH